MTRPRIAVLDSPIAGALRGAVSIRTAVHVPRARTAWRARECYIEGPASGARRYATRPEQPGGSQQQRGSLGARAARAWSSTPTRWYPIPIALGGLVLLAVQYRRSSNVPRPDAVHVDTADERGASVSLRQDGPWQVRVLGALPLRSLSQLWGYLNGLVLPVWFRPMGFRLYGRIFGCNMDEVEYDDLTQYESLGEFFYRRLKEGSRVVDEGAALVSPADGRVLHFGEIHGTNVEQVKGMTYSLDALLGVAGQNVNKTIDTIDYKEGSRKGKVVDDQNFAKINDIGYSLSSLLGSSTEQHSVEECAKEHAHPKNQNPASAPEDASLASSHPESTSFAHDAGVAATIGSGAREPLTGSNTAQGGESRGGEGKGVKGGVPRIKPGNKLFFCVVYLAPGDYHRFHSPTAWVVERRRHFTGDLFSVSPYIANRLKNLFVLNERVALSGRWRYGFFSMVPVGATNVGSIVVNFDAALRTNTRHPTHPPHTFTEAVYTKASSFLQGQPLAAGEEMGGFRLGSTIVMVFEAPERFKFEIEAGQLVKVGQKMGVIKEKEGGMMGPSEVWRWW